MQFTFDIPAQIADALALRTSDVAGALREAALVELYRREQITHHELAQALGLDRFEIDALLNAHRVVEDLPTIEAHRADVDNLRRLLDRP
jgi:hypothetical protein